MLGGKMQEEVESAVVETDATVQKLYRFEKRDYLSTIRRTVFMDNFFYFFLFSLIAVYLLSKGVEPWVAVSIPLVIRIARLFTSSSKWCLKLSLSISHKRVYLVFMAVMTGLGLLLLFMRTAVGVILVTSLCGVMHGIMKTSSVSLATQNPNYESHCLITYGRAQVLGSLLGSLFGQFIFDIGETWYIVLYVIIGIFSVAFNVSMREIQMTSKPKDKNNTESSVVDVKLSPSDKKKIFTCSSIFASFISMWAMAEGVMGEVAPLVSSRLGFANALLYCVALITLFLITGRMLAKIKASHNLLLVEFILAFVGCLCTFALCVFKTEYCLFIIYGIAGIGTALGDPIWASIISSMAQNSRVKYVKIMHLYYLYSMFYVVLSVIVCSLIVKYNIDYMKYVAFTLLIAVTALYVIFELFAKKYYKRSI